MTNDTKMLIAEIAYVAVNIVLLCFHGIVILSVYMFIVLAYTVVQILEYSTEKGPKVVQAVKSVKNVKFYK